MVRSYEHLPSFQRIRTPRVLARYPTTRFIEYVDGAGYFSSLNGDLKKLLGMPTTRAFFQVRSACLRLRRELQAVGFITPLEIEHVIARLEAPTPESIAGALIGDGYSETECRRAIQNAISQGLVIASGNFLRIRPDVRDNARQYLLLDLIAIHGREVQLTSSSSAANVLVPGYGAFYGLEIDRLAKLALAEGGEFREDLNQTIRFTDDLRALSSRGAVMMR